MTFPTHSFNDIRDALLQRRELALLDVREEADYAEAHPLFAANLPLGRIELDAYGRIPRRTTPLVIYDNGEGYAERAARVLQALGYSDIHLLEGGLEGWRAAGGELFRDVNSASKAFGELVEAKRHTPALDAAAVKKLLDTNADVVVVDARRFDEYQTMSIPTATSVPGAELVLRIRELAPNPQTQIVVNCAGRTRSIIGTQSLVNAGIPNPVAALRNGTIGWTLASQPLEHGQNRRYRETSAGNRAAAAQSARAVADRAGVKRASAADLLSWHRESDRTTYYFDVRSPEEYADAHLPGFQSAPGGQLVQETDHLAPVRGARIVLVDDDGVRANMTASWLAQMAWDVYVLDAVDAQQFSARGAWQAPTPPRPDVPTVTATQLDGWLQQNDTVLLDFTTSARHAQRHIPAAHFALRSQLDAALEQLPPASRYVVTCGSGALACYAVAEVRAATQRDVYLLEGGTNAWAEANLPLATGLEWALSPAIDRYRRPYEGTDNSEQAMRDYLEWEYGLVAQLERDGTHGFFVI